MINLNIKPMKLPNRLKVPSLARSHLARLMRALGKIKFLRRILFPLRNLSPKKRRALTGIALIILIIAIPISIYVLKHAGVTQAAWFDEKFGFRQIVAITNSGSAQTNYQVAITLDTATLITAGKMRSDCNDIRITDINGKLLPFWTETGGSNGCNTTTTKIWTKVPSIPTSGQTVYVYYGNPSATIKSDISWMPTGGTITLLSDGHRVHKFTTSGTFTTTANLYVETLVVAGGGGGGMDMGGGGGGGGVISNTAYTVAASPITVTVGEGGAGAPAAGTGGQPSGHQYTISASNGQNSVFGTQTAIGGGKGGSSYWGYTPDFGYGGTGGSGGGSSGYKEGVGSADRAGAGTAGQGNRGGQSSNNYYSGGGGGAGAAGADGPSQPNGGDGVANSILGTSYYWGGGGGGASYSLSTGGNGGNGGGGGGALGTTTGGSGLNSGSAGGGGACCSWANTPGGNAGANTGGGGGGGSHYNATNKGGDGGSGIVAVRYPSATGPSVASPTNEEKGPGPVAYWKFDEGTGTAAKDSSSNKLNGTITGATWQTEDQCISVKCLRFDGSGDYVSTNNSLSTQITSGTMEAWIKTSNAGSSHRGIVVKQAAYGMFLKDNVLIIYDWGGGGDRTTNVNLADGRWHHVVATFQSGITNGTILYIDGVAKLTTTMTISNQNQSLSIGTGSSTSNGQDFTGQIDEPKIYSYARTAAQIKADYSSRGSSKGSSVILGSATTPGSALSNGLVGYWKMDESSGNVADSSGNGLTATATNTPTFTSGKFGNSASLTAASSQYFDVGDPASGILDFGTGSFSMAAWVKTTATGYQRIISKGNSGFTDGYLLQIYTGTGYISTGIGAGGNQANSIFFYSSNAVNDGSWHHVVTIFNQTTKQAQILIDGQPSNLTKFAGTCGTVVNSNILDFSACTSLAVSSAANFNLGRYDGGGEYYNGQIDEARIYNRALSPAEVSQLYNFAPGPVAYYQMDEGTGSTLRDSSGNGYDSTLFSGTPNWAQGKFGKSLYFDGSTNSITLPASILAKKPKQITFEIWLKGKDQPTNTSLFAAHPSQKVNVHAPWSDSNMYWDYGEACCNGRINKAMPSNYMNNNWTHFAFTADTDTNFMQIYANGVLWHSGVVSANTMVNAPTSFYLGSYDGTNYKYKGWMDEFKIYDYVRTSKQIVSDMNAGHPAPGSPVGSAVGYWKMDEGYGAVANNSGSQGPTLQGSLNGMASPPTVVSGWSQDGKFGKALSYDGINDYVSTTSGPSVTDTITFSLWVKGGNTGNQAVNYPLSLGSSGTIRLSLKVGGTYSDASTAANGISLFDGTNASSTVANTFTHSSDDGVWHHIVAIYDANATTKTRIFKDGKELVMFSQGITGSLPSQNQINIGRRVDNVWFWPGQIDEVKIYNSALTASDIKTDYNRGASMVLGSMSNTSGLAGGSVASNSASAEYCIPGDTTSCASPVGRWDFEEGQGATVNDISGNGNTGTWTGTAPYWTQGKYGKGGKFNGTDDYVSSASNTGISGDATFTMEAWFKTNTLGGQAVVFTGISASSLTAASLFINVTSGAVSAEFAGSNGARTAGGLITTGRWYHLAAVKTPGAINTTTKIYLNGVEQTLSTSSTNTPNITNGVAIIGQFGTSGSYFSGLIDQVRIFNYARTAAQIAYDYNRGAPVGWWKFDECQGPTLNDSSGNGNLGTINGSTALGTCADGTNTTKWNKGSVGKFNSSLYFDGTDDNIGLGASTPVAKSNLITVTAWIKPTGSNSRIVNRGWCNQYGWLMHESLGFGVNNSTGCSAQYWASFGTITAGNWYFLTGIFDGSKVYAYKNGVLMNQLNAPSVDLSQNNYSLDMMANEGGQLDEVRIYNYVLTKQQIQQVYNQGSAVRFGPVTGTP